MIALMLGATMLVSIMAGCQGSEATSSESNTESTSEQAASSDAGSDAGGEQASGDIVEIVWQYPATTLCNQATYHKSPAITLCDQATNAATATLPAHARCNKRPF